MKKEVSHAEQKEEAPAGEDVTKQHVSSDGGVHVIMSANTDDECMIEAYRSYRNLPIEYIAFTKIDEAVRYGALYNLLLTYQKPVAYLTTGQKVPGDIEYATANRLASLIVNKECAA